ncbi:MAG: NAD(P)-dependent oxidoreductase [Candidatus Omnitrophica bacterium]|nr:NAD(P)-dependent oxidoreductase [Candidatus Omnitrophota bacterium]
MSKKIVVFGGAGFLGSHVADALSERGYDVTIYDLKESPYLREDQRMVTGNVLDEKKVNAVLAGAEYVYNFSGIADIEECSDNPLKSVKHNILGHAIILDGCMQNRVKRVVYASSVYVYGRHGSFYRITKQACEQLLEEYHEKYALEHTILRYGSLYGPRSQMWNGVYRYIYQALKEQRIDYAGAGEEKREYIHVFDAARLSADMLGDEFKNKCIVITGNYILSSKELLTMIKEMLNDTVKIKYTKEKSSQHYNITPHSFVPKLGIKITPNPSIDMGEGILRQIEQIYKEVKDEPRVSNGLQGSREVLGEDADPIAQYK